jgi:DNA-binding NarL/FixJ family response regulator
LFNILQEQHCLILDPNQFSRGLVKEILRFGGPKNIEVNFASNADQAMLVLREGLIRFIAMEIRLPYEEALDFIVKVRRGKSLWNFDVTVPIIGYAEGFTPQELYQLRDTGISELMVKPLSAGVFFKCLKSAASRKFIQTDIYCGPDRRRRVIPSFSAKKRADDRAAELAAAKAEEDRKKAEADALAAEAARAAAAQSAAAKAESDRKAKAVAEAERKAAASKAEEERKKREAETAQTAAVKVDPSAMTQEELAQHLRKNKS